MPREIRNTPPWVYIIILILSLTLIIITIIPVYSYCYWHGRGSLVLSPKPKNLIVSNFITHHTRCQSPAQTLNPYSRTLGLHTERLKQFMQSVNLSPKSCTSFEPNGFGSTILMRALENHQTTSPHVETAEARPPRLAGWSLWPHLRDNWQRPKQEELELAVHTTRKKCDCQDSSSNEAGSCHH